MKVLIIDDEPLVRRSLLRAVRARGHTAREAEDGEEGLRLWNQEEPDLVFLDVLMPGLSGPELLSEKHPRGSARVILMSAYSGEHNMETAQQMGADLFIPKPFEDIFQVIEQGEDLCRQHKKFR